MIRVYPDASRISSSNFNPCDFWVNGVQMAAMNIQSPDDFAIINRIKFLENGGNQSGYLLKPSSLKNSKTINFKTYRIDVYSGQIIDKTLLDENDFLEIYVIGPYEEEFNQKYKLNFSSNFIHPAIIKKFKDQIEFNIRFPDFSFFVFKIRNSSSKMKMIGAIPVCCCRLGIRVLELFDQDFFMSKYSYLLLRIAIK